jgi:hypothetical protein
MPCPIKKSFDRACPLISQHKIVFLGAGLVCVAFDDHSDIRYFAVLRLVDLVFCMQQ